VRNSLLKDPQNYEGSCKMLPLSRHQLQVSRGAGDFSALLIDEASRGK
jgi:hypothetical protein